MNQGVTTTFDVVVPALTLPTPAGDVDIPATRAYAARGARTWVDYFILSGSTTRGDRLTASQRAQILDLWLDVTDAHRLLACCWEPADLDNARERRITPMVVMRGLCDHDAALAFLHSIPAGAYIYSHPMFGGVTFDAQLAGLARDARVLPAGGKLAKVSVGEVRGVYDAAGASFRLWDGSSRHITASLDVGAAGIVATPLCAFDRDLPPKERTAIQAAIDPAQATLDDLPDRPARTDALLKAAGRIR